jgi:hypothetical protein
MFYIGIVGSFPRKKNIEKKSPTFLEKKKTSKSFCILRSNKNLYDTMNFCYVGCASNGFFVCFKVQAETYPVTSMISKLWDKPLRFDSMRLNFDCGEVFMQMKVNLSLTASYWKLLKLWKSTWHFLIESFFLIFLMNTWKPQIARNSLEAAKKLTLRVQKHYNAPQKLPQGFSEDWTNLLEIK